MAGTINLANVALGFDASKITRGVDLTAGEMRKLNGIFQGSISNVDKYNAELAILEKGRKAGAFTTDRLAQAEASLARKYGETAQASRAAHTSIGSDLTRTLAQYASMAAAFAVLKKSLSLAATAESNKISLEVLTGSAVKAQMLYEGFVDLDRNSPLSRSSFSDAAQKLIGFGVAAESTLPALRQLSEISIGNNDKFQSLALAFGQTQAAGRLMGQEVLQMINAGFNPLQEISRTTGRSMVELKKAMENGAISSSMVGDALESATSKGGRFYEMNERLKNSAAGQWAKMQSDVELLATEIGSNLLPATKSFMDLLNSGQDKSGQGGALSTLAQAFGVGAEGIMALGSDAFTNLDGNSKGTKFDDMQDRLQTERMTKTINAEFVHVKTKEEKERIAAKMAERQAKERKELEEIAKKEQEAINEKKKLEKEAADAKKKEAADSLKELQNIWKELGEEEEKRKKAAADLGKSMLTPLEEYKAELARMTSLLASGHIDQALMDKGKTKADQKLIDKAKSNDKSDALSISQTIAPALKAGSVEAYKFMLNQKDKLYEAAQEQKAVTVEALEVAKKQLAAAENQPLLNTRR